MIDINYAYIYFMCKFICARAMGINRHACIYITYTCTCMQAECVRSKVNIYCYSDASFSCKLHYLIGVHTRK